MDKRVEAFMADVLTLEGEEPDAIRDGVRRRLAVYEKQFREAETDKRMEDMAFRAFRALCRARVVVQIRSRKGTLTAEYLKLVLSVIDGPERFQSEGQIAAPVPGRF